MVRVLFLGEGPSDAGIVPHLERLAEQCGIMATISAPKTDLLPSPDRTVAGKLRSVRALGGRYDLVVIHRDADNAGRDARLAEILTAAEAVMPDALCSPAIPVRMTEAWLVLDEQQIRRVAGNPNGRMKLQIPHWKEAERLADPKSRLRDLLAEASGLAGRRRRTFLERMSHHRAQMLEQLDPTGPVSRLPSWQAFEDGVRTGYQRLT